MLRTCADVAGRCSGARFRSHWFVPGSGASSSLLCWKIKPRTQNVLPCSHIAICQYDDFGATRTAHASRLALFGTPTISNHRREKYIKFYEFNLRQEENVKIVRLKGRNAHSAQCTTQTQSARRGKCLPSLLAV